MNKRIGVILVGHGSNEKYNKELIEYYTEKLRNSYDYVTYAFIQINEPLLNNVLSEVLKKDLDEIIVQPVFLARGAHVDYDIPKILGLSKGEKIKIINSGNKKVKIIYSNPIGKDDRIVDILHDRIKESLKIEGSSN
jgi:sirohydrochlorin cobaltochelatase